MKRYILSTLSTLALLLTFSFAQPLIVAADSHEGQSSGGSSSTSTSSAKDAVCDGLPGGCDPSGSTSSVNQIIKTIISILSFIVGVVAVIMVIIGGFKYILSSGDSANVTSAKNTILYAIIGLVVVAFAQIIVRFVLNTAA